MRGSAGRRAPSMQQFNSLKNAMNGQKLRMNRQLGPPGISSRPYNSLCLKLYVRPEGALKLVDVGTVATALVLQTGIGPQAQPKLNIKFRSVKMWAVATATLIDPPEAQLNVSAITGYSSSAGAAASDFHATQVILTDTGTLNEAAKMGYVYPLAQQKIPVPADSEFTLFSVTSNTPSVVLHIDCSWSLTDVAPEPTV